MWIKNIKNKNKLNNKISWNWWNSSIIILIMSVKVAKKYSKISQFNSIVWKMAKDITNQLVHLDLW